MQGYIFNRGLHRALNEIGFSKDNAAKYLFHGWRYFYTSYMFFIINVCLHEALELMGAFFPFLETWTKYLFQSVTGNRILILRAVRSAVYKSD